MTCNFNRLTRGMDRKFKIDLLLLVPKLKIIGEGINILYVVPWPFKTHYSLDHRVTSSILGLGCWLDFRCR